MYGSVRSPQVWIRGIFWWWPRISSRDVSTPCPNSTSSPLCATPPSSSPWAIWHEIWGRIRHPMDHELIRSHVGQRCSPEVSLPWVSFTFYYQLFPQHLLSLLPLTQSCFLIIIITMMMIVMHCDKDESHDLMIPLSFLSDDNDMWWLETVLDCLEHTSRSNLHQTWESQTSSISWLPCMIRLDNRLKSREHLSLGSSKRIRHVFKTWWWYMNF